MAHEEWDFHPRSVKAGLTMRALVLGAPVTAGRKAEPVKGRGLAGMRQLCCVCRRSDEGKQSQGAYLSCCHGAQRKTNGAGEILKDD